MGQWHDVVAWLRGRRYRRGVIDANTPWHAVEFAAGLTAEEFERVETRHGFRFPDDLREFLATALPVGSGFPDWRHGDAHELAERLDWPKHGLLFDVEHDALWLPEWGPRPQELAEALAVAGAAIDAAPRLVPVFVHRMIATEPQTAGNPVFSVWQADIIQYGPDLERYLRVEFLGEADLRTELGRRIRFWSHFVDD